MSTRDFSSDRVHKEVLLALYLVHVGIVLQAVHVLAFLDGFLNAVSGDVASLHEGVQAQSFLFPVDALMVGVLAQHAGLVDGSCELFDAVNHVIQIIGQFQNAVVDGS